MPRPIALVVLALLLPTASAFSSTPNDLLIAWDAGATPVVVGAGEIGIEGALTGGFFVGGATQTRLVGVPHVSLAELRGEDSVVSELTDVTIEISSGGALWSFPSGALRVDAGAPYAIALALPQAPVPSEPGETPPSGFLIAAESLTGSARWDGGPMDLIPLDAVITLRDSTGQPLPDWDARHVNAQADDTAVRADGAGLDVSLRLDGPFEARLAGAILGGAAEEGTGLTISVSRAPEDRFRETVRLLEATSAELGPQGETFSGEQGPLAMLQQMSGLLNGALLVVGGDGTSAEAIPRLATWGEDDFAVGVFNLVRGDDLALAWEDGEMRVAGEPTVALGRDGFAVEPPATIGVIPLVALFLWLVAIGCVIWWIVDRPPKAKSELTYRLLSLGAWVLVLLVTLWLWDRSFTQTFGTGVLQVAREEGVSAATLPRLGVLAALELVPWSIAGLLFALPVRIAAGVALQQLGKGKSFKGLASAAGLISLAILGPIYALWCFNLVWSRAAAMSGGLGG